MLIPWLLFLTSLSLSLSQIPPANEGHVQPTNGKAWQPTNVYTHTTPQPSSLDALSMEAHVPHRVVLPPLENQWSQNQRVLRSQPSLDLEGGAKSPLPSPRVAGSGSSPPDSSRHRQSNNPAAASVGDLVEM
jgi:hypothetical protein